MVDGALHCCHIVAGVRYTNGDAQPTKFPWNKRVCDPRPGTSPEHRDTPEDMGEFFSREYTFIGYSEVYVPNLRYLAMGEGLHRLNGSWLNFTNKSSYIETVSTGSNN